MVEGVKKRISRKDAKTQIESREEFVGREMGGAQFSLPLVTRSMRRDQPAKWRFLRLCCHSQPGILSGQLSGAHSAIEYGIERSELSQRGSRHPARAAIAYLARRPTAATNGELTKIVGMSRAESVPNLTGRFETWLLNESRVCKQLGRLRNELNSTDIAE
jgi:hypothetical protein